MRKECDVIVCLSHMGTLGKHKGDVCDSVMVTCTRGIDVVVGGHTHKVYRDLRVANLDGDSIPVSHFMDTATGMVPNPNR